ncbi:MAG: HDOD domain-containing protein [Myxococcales bacterium FL481]|nr:MAG: HDOD domain-containing protein [Myxococcales bacterium FL481]
MIDILLVDDEIDVLEGLENTLRPQRRQWRVHLAHGGPEAVECLSRHRYDVVVTDMRMPQIDGVAVLKHALTTQPHAIRIVLSGYATAAAVINAACLAHDVLAKPCDLAELRGVIDRMKALEHYLDDPVVRSSVAQFRTLLPASGLYSRVGVALDQPDATVKSIAAVVANEPQLACELLKLANSAWMSPAMPIESVDDAVSWLGLDTTRALALAEDLWTGENAAAQRDGLRAHTLEVASLAKQAFPELGSGRLTAAALLHDLGRALPLADTVDHTKVGAALLALWGMPSALVEAVAFHHLPEASPQAQPNLATAIYVADQLAHGRDLAHGPCAGLLDLPWLRARRAEWELLVA